MAKKDQYEEEETESQEEGMRRENAPPGSTRHNGVRQAKREDAGSSMEGHGGRRRGDHE